MRNPGAAFVLLRRAAFVLLPCGILVAGLVFWWGDPALPPVDHGTGDAEPAPPVSVAREVLSHLPSLTSAEVVDDHGLTPGEVVDNADCTMLAGRGRASDAAIVVVPSPSGAQFAVLDGNGEVFGDALSFLPHQLHVGRQADGTLVAGLGDLRLNSRVFREPDTPEPVRIYVDGQIAYETPKALNFAIAPDGSSFYVHEPMAGGASRLVVRNLDLGNETHFDLGTGYAPASAYDSGYEVRYAKGSEEVVFARGGDNGRGLYQFYSVADEVVRSIRIGSTNRSIADVNVDIEIDDDVFMARMVSSEEGYFAYSPDAVSTGSTGTPEPWRIFRRRFGFDEEPSFTEVWSRQIDLRGYAGTMVESDDGRWLGLRAWDFVLLDAATGETVFEFPKVDDEGQLQRLASVLDEDATVVDAGTVTSESFRGDQLLMYRKIGSTRSCNAKAMNGLDQYYECIADLRRRGIFRTVLDVFELNTIGLDSQPRFRVEYDARNQCATGDFPLRGLQVHDGRLTFLRTKR